MNESIFPADYIITIFGLFLFLLADRAVYVLASNKLRMYLHYLLIPAYFTGGMLMYWQRAPDHPSYTCIFMFVKCFSLAMELAVADRVSKIHFGQLASQALQHGLLARGDHVLCHSLPVRAEIPP